MYMRRALVALALMAVTVAACHRKVDTTTAPAKEPPPGPTYTLTVTNNLTKSVNVYVTNAGVDTFLRQVQPTATEQVPVKGIPGNTPVTLKATTSDGSSTYTKANVSLASNYTWVVP
jgi:hypothetical protein